MRMLRGKRKAQPIRSSHAFFYFIVNGGAPRCTNTCLNIVVRLYIYLYIASHCRELLRKFHNQLLFCFPHVISYAIIIYIGSDIIDSFLMSSTWNIRCFCNAQCRLSKFSMKTVQCWSTGILLNRAIAGIHSVITKCDRIWRQ